MSEQHPLVERMLTEITQALKQFGEYTFGDKGPQEVMDLDSLEDAVRRLPPNEAGDVLLDVASTGHHGELLVSSLLGYMQDWDELFDNEDVADLL